MWGWRAVDGGDVELTGARDRKVAWRLRDQGEASLTLTSSGPDDQAALITELRTDLVVTWDKRALWRGRFGPSTDRIDEVSHEVTFGAVDYRGVLSRRFTHSAIDLDAVDLAAAGWELIDHTQRDTGLDGGPLGIGRVSLPATSTGDVDFPVGKQIAEAIDETSQRVGFDWWIDADMLYRAEEWRGSQAQRDFALIFGETVNAVDLTFDPTAYANTIIQTGADGLTPAIVAAADLAVRPEGRWESVETGTDIANQDALDGTALINLARKGALPLSFRCRLRPGVWTPDDLWIGDMVRIVVRSGRKNIDQLERVVEVAVTDSPDGTPEVDIVVGNTLAADLAALMRRLPARLTQLSRRT